MNPDQVAVPQARVRRAESPAVQGQGGGINEYEDAVRAYYALNPAEASRSQDIPRQARELQEAMRDGRLTRREFNGIFSSDSSGLHVTQEAWDAFIFRRQGEEGVIRDIGSLNRYFREFQNFADGTGITFAQFADSDHITRIPPAQMFSFMSGMIGSDDCLRALLQRRDFRDLAEQVVQRYVPDYLRGANRADVRLSDSLMQELLYNALRRMLETARTGSGQGNPLVCRRGLEMLGMVFLNHLVNSPAGREFDVNDLPLGDPLNAQHFLSRILLAHLTGYEEFPQQAPSILAPPAGEEAVAGESPAAVDHVGQEEEADPDIRPAALTHERMAEMNAFSRRVARLRTMIGADPVLTRLLNNADDRSPAFQQALALVDEGASLARITPLLKQGQSVEDTPVPPPVPAAVPTDQRPPIVQVQPIAPSDEPVEENHQETPPPAAPTASLLPGQQVSLVS